MSWNFVKGDPGFGGEAHRWTPAARIVSTIDGRFEMIPGNDTPEGFRVAHAKTRTYKSFAKAQKSAREYVAEKLVGEGKMTEAAQVLEGAYTAPWSH